MKKLISFFILIAILQYSVASYAVKIQLYWDIDYSPAVAGYKLFVRERDQEFNYDSPYTTTNADTRNATVYDLVEDKSYAFVVRSYDAFGNMSEPSNELGPILMSEVCQKYSETPMPPPDGSGGCYLQSVGDCDL